MTNRRQYVTSSSIAVLFSVLAGTASAQTLTAEPTTTRDVTHEGTRLAITLPADGLTIGQQPRRDPPPPPPDDRRRRRPSMVGYINDAGIQSQVRMRLDVGSDIDAPDRAEFFYAKCGCYRFLPSDHPAFDPDAPGPGPGIVTSLDFRQLYVLGEYAIRDRISVFGELPVRWIQPDGFLPDTGSFDNQSGLSDLRAGLKWALVAEDDQFLTLQVQGSFPTGDPLKGMGVDHFSFEPALLYNQSLNDQVNLEAQFGVVLPAGGSNGIANASEDFSGNVLYYGIGPSFEIYQSPELRIAPVVELVGWRVLGGFDTSVLGEVEGINIVNLKLGSRFEFRGRSSIYAGYGFALTDDVWYDNLLRVEYRYTF